MELTPFIAASMETLEERQLLSVSIPTRHHVAVHAAHPAVSARLSPRRVDGVRPIIKPAPPFSTTNSGTGGTGDGGGGIINHPGGFHSA